jgi:hypothetical protein
MLLELDESANITILNSEEGNHDDQEESPHTKPYP